MHAGRASPREKTHPVYTDIHACVWVILLWLPALFLGASPRDWRPRGNDVRRPLCIDLKIAAKRDRRCRPALHSSTHLVHRRRRHVRLPWRAHFREDAADCHQPQQDRRRADVRGCGGHRDARAVQLPGGVAGFEPLGRRRHPRGDDIPEQRLRGSDRVVHEAGGGYEGLRHADPRARRLARPLRQLPADERRSLLLLVLVLLRQRHTARSVTPNVAQPGVLTCAYES
mmetsp:Transcript_41217/g.68966  ORF Transcript_41217/g.68966 Transcript_41217/m.68966 type:complete len:228 (+) Transcript_41217:1167-1850(+)